MKELIKDVYQLHIEVLRYRTVCQIVWRKLSHCSCLKENWNVLFNRNVRTLHSGTKIKCNTLGVNLKIVKSTLCKSLNQRFGNAAFFRVINFIPITSVRDEFRVKEDHGKCFRCWRLKAHFHNTSQHTHGEAHDNQLNDTIASNSSNTDASNTN